MAVELNFIVDQADNGKSVKFVDSTNWDNPADTGISSIKIEIKSLDNITYTVLEQTFTTIVYQNNLSFIIPSTAFGYSSNTAPIDGAYRITYTVTGTVTGVATKDVLFDYNSKFFVYSLYKELPYKFPLGMKWNPNIQEAVIGDVLLTAMEYSADVGQVQKMNDFLEAINLYKLRIDG